MDETYKEGKRHQHGYDGKEQDRQDENYGEQAVECFRDEQYRESESAWEVDVDDFDVLNRR